MRFKLRLIGLTFLFILATAMAGSAEQGMFILNQAKLPTGWTLQETWRVSRPDLAAFSNKLQGEITALTNYLLDAAGEILQVNVVECAAPEEAATVYHTLLLMKGSEDSLQLEGKMVLEYIGDNPLLINQAKTSLAFERYNPAIDQEAIYLQDNYSVLQIDQERLWLAEDILASSIEDISLFITAEFHGIAANQELEFAFLKYFQQQAGVKYFLQEIAYSTAMSLNSYLESGDEGILSDLFKSLRGTYGWTKENYRLYQKLYHYNASLPPEERITIIGFDIEHQPENALSYLYRLLPEQDIPPVIEPLIAQLKNIYRKKLDDHNYLKDFARKLKESMVTHAQVYQQYLGENRFGFELVTANLLNRFIAYQEKGQDRLFFNQTRDQMMYDNFIKIYPQLPAGKFYGQWGLNHGLQKRQAGVDWFAARLNEKASPFRGKLLTIIYLYQDCWQMTRSGGGNYGKRKLTTYSSNKPVLDLYSSGDFTLFNLVGTDSPYTQHLFWPLKMTTPTEGVTTDYFQYLLLIRNSGPSTPLH